MQLHIRHVTTYRDEEAVDPNSTTESYVALRANIENWRWAGVPFLLRTGKRLPHRLNERELVLNLGLLTSVSVPLSSIAAVRDQWDSAILRDKDTLSLSPIAYPNRMIELEPPLETKRRALSRIAFRVDESAAFDAAMRELSGSI